MDSDELRRACERAGGIFFPQFNEWHFKHFDGKTRRIPAEQLDLLFAYVASLLVAMVPDKDSRALHLAFTRQFDGLPPAFMKAADEQRIRASMEVLGDD